MQTESGSDWLSHIEQTLASLGFTNIWLNTTSVPKKSFLAELEQRSRDQYVQTWNSQLSSTTGKLRFYKLFKTTFEREPYLNLPPHFPVPVAKLRISCHPLQIETSRYTLPNPIPCSERFCCCCEGKVEDELHFETLPEQANLLQFCQDKLNSCYNHLEDIEKIKLLWSTGNSQALYLLGVFLLKAFHTRKQYI